MHELVEPGSKRHPISAQAAERRQLWHKCGKCGTMVFVKEWEENYSVCPRCNFHDRIGPATRFEQLFDAAQYELLPSPEVREDPLRFRIPSATPTG